MPAINARTADERARPSRSRPTGTAILSNSAPFADGHSPGFPKETNINDAVGNHYTALAQNAKGCGRGSNSALFAASTHSFDPLRDAHGDQAFGVFSRAELDDFVETPAVPLGRHSAAAFSFPVEEQAVVDAEAVLQAAEAELVSRTAAYRQVRARVKEADEGAGKASKKKGGAPRKAPPPAKPAPGSKQPAKQGALARAAPPKGKALDALAEEERVLKTAYEEQKELVFELAESLSGKEKALKKRNMQVFATIQAGILTEETKRSMIKFQTHLQYVRGQLTGVHLAEVERRRKESALHEEALRRKRVERAAATVCARVDVRGYAYEHDFVSTPSATINWDHTPALPGSKSAAWQGVQARTDSGLSRPARVRLSSTCGSLNTASKGTTLQHTASMGSLKPPAQCVARPSTAAARPQSFVKCAPRSPGAPRGAQQVARPHSAPLPCAGSAPATPVFKPPPASRVRPHESRHAWAATSASELAVIHREIPNGRPYQPYVKLVSSG